MRVAQPRPVSAQGLWQNSVRNSYMHNCVDCGIDVEADKGKKGRKPWAR